MLKYHSSAKKIRLLERERQSKPQCYGKKLQGGTCRHSVESVDIVKSGNNDSERFTFLERLQLLDTRTMFVRRMLFGCNERKRKITQILRQCEDSALCFLLFTICVFLRAVVF
jgi:hypothetical protein